MMQERIVEKLKMLEATQRRGPQHSTRTGLRVYYGWSKINKICKREAISVIYENEEGVADHYRTGKALARAQHTVYWRYQTEGEANDAKQSNRAFTVYYVFLDDPHIKGSVKKAVSENMKADIKNVSESVLKEIAERLETAYLTTHPGYREPTRELDIEF